LQFHLASLQLPGHLEAGVGENVQGGSVLGHYVGDELSNTCFARSQGELLQQACADAAALLLVGDREGELGSIRVAQACITGERDDVLAAPAAGERADQRALLDPVRFEEGLDEASVGAANAVKAQV